MPRPTSVLSLPECWTLLRSTRVGRVVYTENTTPAARRVGFALQGDRVLVRTRPDAWAATIDQTIVGFTVDDIDPGTGWCVIVIGEAHWVTCTDALPALPGPARQPPGHIVAIGTEHVTGLSITAGDGP